MINKKSLLYLSFILLFPLGIFGLFFNSDFNFIASGNDSKPVFLKEPGSLREFHAAGYIDYGTVGKLFLNDAGTRYLIYETEAYDESVPSIELSQIFPNTTLDINLSYNPGTEWDSDNDGVESKKSVIDFSVSTSAESFCTFWDIYSIDTNVSTTICYGDAACCSALSLTPIRGNSSEPLFLTYGKYNAGAKNIVSASIVSGNSSSAWQSKRAVFVEDKAAFSGCACDLPGLNKTFYTIEAEVSSGRIVVDSVSYKVSSKPKYLGGIPNITLTDTYYINLSQYFSGAEDYGYVSDNISAVINGSIAAISSEGYVYFTANNSYGITFSDLIAVKREKIIKRPKGRPIVGKKIHWIISAQPGSLVLPKSAVNITSRKPVKIRYKGSDRSIKDYENLKREEKKGFGILSLELPQVLVNESTTIEFITDAPTATERKISESKKEIVVSADYEIDFGIYAFTDLPNVPKGSVRLYWKADAQDKLRYKLDGDDLGNGMHRIDITDNSFFNVTFFDNDGDGLTDYVEWLVPHLSSQTFEIEITVLNVQSFPTVGGNWTVEFDTIGAADLEIRAINGTTYSEVPDIFATDSDLEFLELLADGSVEVVLYDPDNNSLSYEAYLIKRKIERIKKRISQLE